MRAANEHRRHFRRPSCGGMGPATKCRRAMRLRLMILGAARSDFVSHSLMPPANILNTRHDMFEGGTITPECEAAPRGGAGEAVPTHERRLRAHHRSTRGGGCGRHAETNWAIMPRHRQLPLRHCSNDRRTCTMLTPALFSANQHSRIMNCRYRRTTRNIDKRP